MPEQNYRPGILPFGINPVSIEETPISLSLLLCLELTSLIVSTQYYMRMEKS